MTFEQGFICVAFACGCIGNILALVLGFKMGRLRDGQKEIFEPKIKDEHKDAIDEPDIFSQHVNDGTEGDPNERIRTL